jgi:hypothetical protein
MRMSPLPGSQGYYPIYVIFDCTLVKKSTDLWASPI